MRLGDRVGTYLIRNSVHSLATSSRVAASRMHGNATGRSRDGRGEGGEGSARYCVREREDRDGERGRRERGIKAREAPEPVVMSWRSVRIPTRKEAPAALTRIHARNAGGGAVRCGGARGELHGRSRLVRAEHAEHGREKERDKCLGRGKGSRGGRGVAGRNAEESRVVPREHSRPSPVLPSRPSSFICLAPSAWEADPN